MSDRPRTYAEAGVDIAAGDALVRRIAPMARATMRPGSLGGLGGFGALFDPRAAGFKDPLLVAATDGVGTKLKLAIETGRMGGIGIDLVAMCVNDLVCQGAEPLFFLDYYATGRLDVGRAADVVEGIAAGCREAGCALIGGETAEMPGLYAGGEFDLAGFAVGAVERGRALPSGVVAGDRLIGLCASGLHSNGFSLVRRIVEADRLDLGAAAPFEERPLGEALLEPTRIYVADVLAAIRAGGVHAVAHITGGGLVENLPRVLPDGIGARCDLGAWPVPPVVRWLAEVGGIAEAEMLRTFNCGIGMVLVVDARAADALLPKLQGRGQAAWVIGEVVAGRGVALTGALG